MDDMTKKTKLELVRLGLGAAKDGSYREVRAASDELRRRAVAAEEVVGLALQVKHERSPWLGHRLVSRLSAYRQGNLLRRLRERAEDFRDAGREDVARRYEGALDRAAYVTG